MEIIIFEKESNARYIAYIYTSLMPILEACGAKSSVSFDGDRISLRFDADERYAPYLRRIAEEKVAEVIAVGYKYELFRAFVKPAGLGKNDHEILLTALISADFADDKRYVFMHLKGMKIYCIDGFFNFRLSALKEKWKGVVRCVPPVFTREKLTSFMGYLLAGDGGRKVIVRGSEIFDGKYRKLRRATLIEEGISELNGIREIILSGAGAVECVGLPPPCQEEFLRRYFAGRVSFL